MDKFDSHTVSRKSGVRLDSRLYSGIECDAIQPRGMLCTLGCAMLHWACWSIFPHAHAALNMTYNAALSMLAHISTHICCTGHDSLCLHVRMPH
eukprot:310820-Pelagomonas_calceolata.AAC.1